MDLAAEVRQHERRLQHAASAWGGALAAMAAPAGGAAAPSAEGGRPLGQQEAQLAEHATKLLSLPLLSIGQLPCRLRDATVEQIVRMYADCMAQQARAEAHGCAAWQCARTEFHDLNDRRRVPTFCSHCGQKTTSRRC